MEAAINLVAQALTIIGAIASVYLAVGIAVAFLEAQVAGMLGSPGLRADVMRRISLLALCVAVIAFAQVIKDDLAFILTGPVEDAAGIRASILRIGVYFVDILIGIAVVLMAVGIAFGFLDAQVHAILGEPAGLSVAMSRVAAVTLMGVGALFTVVISQIVVNALVH